MTIPKSLIINSPFERPTHYWRKEGDRQLEIVAAADLPVMKYSTRATILFVA